MKNILLACLLMASAPVLASPFSIAKSGGYEKMQCDGGACNWLQWQQNSVSVEGGEIIVRGTGKIALSEFEERRRGEERMVDAKDVVLVVRCSTENPQVTFNGSVKDVMMDGSVNPVSGVYFRVCHNIAPASASKFRATIDKFYTDGSP